MNRPPEHKEGKTMKKKYISPDAQLEYFLLPQGTITTSFEIPDIELEDIPALDASEV